MASAHGASDRIVVNAGGRRYETTGATLKAAHFFQALLGPTGAALGTTITRSNTSKKKKRKHSNSATSIDDHNDSTENNRNGNDGSIFVDCDPDLFQDVLYFMRRGRLPAQTASNTQRLEDLQAEADFFAFASLENACKMARKKLQKNMQKLIKDGQPKPSTAYSRCLRLEGNSKTYEEIHIPKGQVLYIVSATFEVNMLYYLLIWEEHRYDRSWNEFKIVVSDEDIEEGDRNANKEKEYAITSVGIGDCVAENKHKVPLILDTHRDIRLCLSRPERGYFRIAADGPVPWHVVYWVGKPEDIPGLQQQSHVNKQNSVTVAPTVLNDGSSAMLAAAAAATIQSHTTIAAAAIAAAGRRYNSNNNGSNG